MAHEGQIPIDQVEPKSGLKSAVLLTEKLK